MAYIEHHDEFMKNRLLKAFSQFVHDNNIAALLAFKDQFNEIEAHGPEEIASKFSADYESSREWKRAWEKSQKSLNEKSRKKQKAVLDHSHSLPKMSFPLDGLYFD